MLPMLLAQIGLPLLVKAVGGALSNSSNSVAKAAGDALGQVDTEIATGRLDGDQLKEANRHLEALATLEANTDQTWLQQVNQTIRAESVSDDAYVRRMRPTFGYIMAFTWAAQMGAIAYTVVADPQQAAPVIAAVASLGTIWTVGLSVLGIYVYRRSGEKQRVLEAQGGLPANQNTGVLQNLLQSLIKSKSKEM
ncbi:3TM-type holin [Hwanghaeella sp. LZ110]|uniref:3TM-type holin n=1 Tax=Hwanghaeella sp. LZ110 TaxID=3402810 RepID=UPI000C4CB8DF|nr:ribokinase [Rhodospirillaceae bacterium]MAX63495.1 ribokinase [Rhodospirillaceae bacterium]MBB56434.1 ribokinase [Rhodospirillaceae bacterium]HAE02162.1 ribokinase [Rhodospirillaceae bacterium]HBM13764.1 ribokinase [Rhodospirillaceae bacterium]